jgi:site-specific DNA-methyltransferase (adenine-specific)
MAGKGSKTKRPRGCSGKGSRGLPGVRLLEGDCLEVLGKLKPESVDAIVTDPPYGIGFQNERWDSAALREAAAKVGDERLTPNQAFEVWSRIWASECRRVLKPGGFLAAFGSPRTSHRLACGIEDSGLEIRDTLMWLYAEGMSKSRRYPGGRATTLKPAFEPIVLARRGLDGTTEETIARHGTGALMTESCRVEGRHPANVLIGHEPDCEDGRCTTKCAVGLADACVGGEGHARLAPSRFLLCPKASRAERDAGCDQLPQRALDLFPNAGTSGDARNFHPTVKPLELMRWLVRLLCPLGGVVLDPTAGSGSTGVAAVLEDRRFIGIELEPAYIEIAAARIKHWRRQAGGAGRPLGGRRR